MSQAVQIELPDGVETCLGCKVSELASEMRLAAAIKWYELGQLSQGKAAEVAALSRVEFISQLARFNVSPFQETADEIIDTVRALRTR